MWFRPHCRGSRSTKSTLRSAEFIKHAEQYVLFGILTEQQAEQLLRTA